MRKILTLLIMLAFVVTISMTIGCPKQEAPKAPPATETAPPAAPAAPAPPAAPEKAPEKK